MGSSKKCGPRAAAGGGEAAQTTTVDALASDLGLGAEAVRALIRDECTIGEEAVMDRVLGGVVLLPAGVEKIRSVVAARMAVPVAPLPVLTVVRVHGAKRLIAEIEGGRRVLCCVQRAEHFRAGMRIEGAREGEGGLWFYQGRLPRRKGVW
jgi:hypothetical protein